jgi:hypothetical protein
MESEGRHKSLLLLNWMAEFMPKDTFKRALFHVQAIFRLKATAYSS